MKNWVRWTLLAQVLFFTGWAGWQEWVKTSAPLVYLETLPVDPRDLLSGQYLQLRYRIGMVDTLPGFPSPAPSGPTPVAVLLKPSMPVPVGGKTYTLWQAVQCQVPPPESLDTPQGLWVVGTRISVNNTLFGIEHYYFNEKRAAELSQIRSGKIYVEAGVGKDGRLVLRNLIY